MTPRFTFRRILTAAWGAAILILVGVLAWQQRGEILKALPYLAHANAELLVVIVLLESLYFWLQGWAVRKLYSLYDREVPTLPLMGMFVTATMMNEVLPTSGASGTAAFIVWGERLGYGLGDTVKVSVWLSLLSYATLGPILVICTRALYVLPTGAKAVLVAALWVVGASVAIFGLVSLAIWAFVHGEDHSQSVRARFRAFTLSNLGPVLLRVGGWRNHARSYTSAELSKEWSRARAKPGGLYLSFALLTAVYGVRILMLQLCFTALHQTLPLSTAAYVYALTLLFSLVSFSPTTLGVVEVALTTTLGWFGTALPVAVAGMLLYRLASFWLPIPAGVAFQWWLGRLAKRENSRKSATRSSI